MSSAGQRTGVLEVALGLTFYVTFSSMNHIQITQLAMYDTPSGGFHSCSPYFFVRKRSLRREMTFPKAQSKTCR